MPLRKVRLQPGINLELTPTLNDNGWSLSNLIRWKNGLPQKRGGWQRLTSVPLVGVGRAMHIWTSLAGRSFLAVGTNERLQLFAGGNIYDITPIRATANITVDYSTTTGLAIVTVHDAAHGASAGDWVDVVVSISVGGLILQGLYLVATVVDADNYTIVAASNATATVANGGAVPAFATTNGSPDVVVTFANHGLAVGGLFGVQVSTTVGGITMEGQYAVTTVTNANVFKIAPGPNAGSTATGSENGGQTRIQYLIGSGFVSATPASGYGVGLYGSGVYSRGGAGMTLAPLRQWFLDNFGEDLVGNYNGSTLYQWVPPVSVYAGSLTASNPATPVLNAPTIMEASLVADPQQMVISLGAETGAVQDPLLVRWCDAGNITVWSPTSSNQAGSFRLSTGSRIVGGLVGPSQVIVWTDTDVWTMQYSGLPFVWGFQKIASECGLISGHAAAALDQQIVWMGVGNFYTMAPGGGVQELPCPVWDDVFDNLYDQQTDKIFCATTSRFDEAVWFFPSADGNGEIDSYVSVNLTEKTWDTGSLVRTTWFDDSAFGPPIGVDGNKLLQQHEVALDADGLPMGEFIQTGFFDAEGGDFYLYLERIIPDFKFDTSTATPPTVLVSVIFLEYPNDAGQPQQMTYGPYTITSTTQMMVVNARSRQFAIRIEGTGLGTFWRFGALRHNARPDGKR